MLRSSWCPRIVPKLKGCATNRLGGCAQDARASLALSQRPRPLTPPCKLAPLRLLRSDKVMSTYMDKEMGAKGCPPHVYAMGEVTDAPPLLPSGPAAPAPARMGLQ